MKFCTRPPAGWFCTRGHDHDGPCAARPDPLTPDVLEAIDDVGGQLHLTTEESNYFARAVLEVINLGQP